MPSEAQRRANKTHAQKLQKAGNTRVSIWLSADAGKALKRLVKRNKMSRTDSICAAIIFTDGA